MRKENVEIKNNLKHFRQLKGLTQQQIADKLCVDLSTYNRKENNKSNFTLDDAVVLVQFLGVTFEELFINDIKY